GSAQPAITDLLLDRFQRTMSDVLPRVHVQPRLEWQTYLLLVAAADVLLDTPHFGAGFTAYDAAGAGTPLGTPPGEFARGRWGAALNRRLGVPQLIATTPQEYVARAIEIARDRELQRSLREQIVRAAPDLFEDAAVVREHEEYFSNAIAESRRV